MDDNRVKSEGISTRWSLAASTLLLIGLSLAFALTGEQAVNPWADLDPEALREALGASAAIVGLAAGGVLIRVWWRHGFGPALWLGLAALALGAAELGTPILTSSRPVGSIEAATAVLAAALAIGAVRSGDVDITTTLFPAVVAALGGWVLLGAAFYEFGSDLAWPVVAAWILVAALCLINGLVRRRWLIGWFGVSAAAVALQRIGELSSDRPAVVLGSGIVLVFGLLLLLLGAAEASRSVYAGESAQLVQRLEEALRRQQEDSGEEAERAHEARAALAVIDHAVTTMDQHPKLEPSTLRTLQDAISTEVELLRRLVTPGGDVPAPFLVSDGLVGAVAAERVYGSDLDLALEPGLRAFGRVTAVAEIMQALLGNARIHATGSPVTIRGYSEHDRIILRVSDRGPGITDPEGVFARGARGATAAPGEGLGLFVARRLATDLGGALWAEETPEGGATLVLSLPPSRSDDRLVYQVDDLAKGDDPSISIAHGTLRL